MVIIQDLHSLIIILLITIIPQFNMDLQKLRHNNAQSFLKYGDDGQPITEI